ncbi:MAG: exodeoxyribonuclease VII large subunit [Candidatus Poribacteria bacterium]|nr:exodeoxyribonuclease VII large subunit [Candidatus Poribacteria bacterium]
MADNVYAVHQITQALQELLEQAVPPLWVEGEVSNFRESQAGHWYFTLRDEIAQMPVVMWKNMTIRHQHMIPVNGALIRVHGSLTIYAQGGNYQIQATRLLPVGQGALQIAFERLRDQLREEGLFEESRKKPIPTLPKHIGVVTSARGAAVRDILNVLARRFPSVRVTVYPAVVQGGQAPSEIVRAIWIANRVGDADVLIVGRGGGSMEDLWAFNSEEVVRAVADSTIPIVSAVGHEVDYTLCDFAADLRAPTPSAAAELVVPDRIALLNGLRSASSRMAESIRSRVRHARRDVERLAFALSPKRQRDAVRQRMQYVDDLARLLESATNARLERQRNRLSRVAASLNALSPLATLERGYAIAFDGNDRVLKDAGDVSSNDAIRVRLDRGELRAIVTNTHTDS